MNEQSMSRRAVLEALAATGLAASLAAGSQATEETIDVGLITEPGGSHLNLFLKALAKCRGVGKVAISDPSGAAFDTARRLLGARFDRSFRDPQEMLQKFQPGLTVITLEACNSPSAIGAALRAKSHVLTEKPSCINVDF